MLADVDAPNTPIDSPGGGTYGSTQSVTLSDATAQFINYTTNGSTPACPATGTLYTGAISVAVTTTIKAIGCNGITGGGVLTSVYTISAGITYIQSASTFYDDSTSDRTLTLLATTVGNKVVLACSNFSTGANASDNGSNTYTQDISQNTYGIQNRIFSAPQGSSATTLTCSASGSSSSFSPSAAEYSGIIASSPVDGTPPAVTNGVGTTVTCPAVTTTNANDVVVAIVANYTKDNPGGTFSSPTGSFNLRTQANGGSTARLSVAYLDQIVSSTGTYTAGVTLSGTEGWICSSYALKGP